MANRGETDEREYTGLKTPAFIAWLIVAGVVVIVGAIYIGKSDNGQIDVAGTIGNSNQAIQDAGGDQSGQVDVVPQSFQNMPNGGLVPQGDSGVVNENESPESPVDATTGSSTEANGSASSTDNTNSDTAEGAVSGETQVADTGTSEATE